MSSTPRDHADEITEQQLRNGAIGQATESAKIDQARGGRSQTFIAEMGDPGISPDEGASDLERRLSAELSLHHVFGNITREEYEGLKITNQALAMQFKAEHPRAAGPSSKCVGRYRQEMFGEDKAVLTDDRAREADSTLGEEGVRSMMQSKSVDAMALEVATRVKSVVATEGTGGGNGSDGLMGSLKGALGIGGDD
ncbi:hypothetical protein [Haloplanus sp. C73]|uniref:hypothetical protein n=1 Tax=Haloplanus sp. C73 TaxID=3421641 RepID=UPI003EBC7A7E